MRTTPMHTSERAVRPVATVAACLVAVMVLDACASSGSSASIAGAEVKPSAPCSDEAVVPQIVATRAATLPATVWDRKLAWDTQLSFRLDDGGTPYAVRASARGLDGDSDRDEIERASAAAFSGYRFCMPVAHAAVDKPWSARMRFRYLRVGAEFGGGEMYRQLFVPAYTREDLSERRAGRVVVRGIFEQNGRPSSLQVMTSSGDVALDRKSMQSMASDQLVFRPGTTLTRPLFFAQPYVYEIH